MAIVLVKHNIKEYNSWRKVYDEHKTFRTKSGMLTEAVYRSTSNPNEIYLLFKWDNILNAKIFVQSEELKNAMQKAGVVSKPEMNFLEEAEQITSTRPIMQPIKN